MTKGQGTGDRAPMQVGTAKVISIVVTLFVAAVAFITSFDHIRQLALDSHQSKLSATLTPLAVDGLLILAAIAMWLSKRSFWTWVALVGGTGGTIAANVASADDNLTAQILSAAPPVTLFLAIEVLSYVARLRATTAEETSPGDKIKDAAEKVAEKSRGLIDTLSPVPVKALAKDVPAAVSSETVPPAALVPGVVLVGRDTVNGSRSPVSPAKLSPARDTVTEAVPEDKPKASPRKAPPAKKSPGAGTTPDWGPVVRDMLGDADTLTKDMVVAIRDKVWPDMSEAAAKKRIQRFRKAEAA